MNRPLLYWLRTGSVVAGVILGIALLKGTEHWTSGAAVGREIFQIATWGAFVLCLLSGVVLTAGLVSPERRDGALALLFLTDLTGLDILIGKLAAIAFLASQMVLGILPLFALCMTLGGVSLGEFWRAVQLLLVTLLFSLSTGLFISALCKQTSRSILFTFAFILAATLLTAGLDWIAARAIGLPVGAIVPGLLPAMNSWADSNYILPPTRFEYCLAYQAVLSLALLLLGGLMLKRLTIGDEGPIRQKRLSPLAERSWVDRWRLLRQNPVYWLALRRPSRWIATWTIFGFLMVLWALAVQFLEVSHSVSFLAIFVFGPMLHLLLKICIAAESVERLAHTRHGELELLLVTPLRGGKILGGHQKALLRHFAFPIATMLMIDLLFAFAYQPPPGVSTSVAVLGYLFIYTLGISLFVDLPALVWCGLWNGLRCQNSVQAMRKTLLHVIVFPIPIILLTMVPPAFVITLIQSGSPAVPDSAALFTGAIIWWWFVGYICNFVLQHRAKFKLNAWLRYVAADPFGTRALIHSRRLGEFPAKP
jgi:hypothetical protein